MEIDSEMPLIQWNIYILEPLEGQAEEIFGVFQVQNKRVITAAREVDNDDRKYSENSQTDIENIRTSNTI